MKVYVLLAGNDDEVVRVCAKKSFAIEGVKNGSAHSFEEFYLEGFDPDEEGEEAIMAEHVGQTGYSVDITKAGEIYAYEGLAWLAVGPQYPLKVQNIVNEAGESLCVGTYRLWADDEKKAVEYAKARWAKDIESGEWAEEERIALGLAKDGNE